MPRADRVVRALAIFAMLWGFTGATTDVQAAGSSRSNTQSRSNATYKAPPPKPASTSGNSASKSQPATTSSSNSAATKRQRPQRENTSSGKPTAGNTSAAPDPAKQPKKSSEKNKGLSSETAKASASKQAAQPASPPPSAPKPESRRAAAARLAAKHNARFTEYRRTKDAYNQKILNGQEDPYLKLVRSPVIEENGETKKGVRPNAVLGPPGSNLFAMARAAPSAGTGYRRRANASLDAHLGQGKEREALIQSIETNIIGNDPALKGGKFIPPERVTGKSGNTYYRNPYVQMPDGSKVRLEWHHSPNHVGTVSLITKQVHRTGAEGMNAIHYVDPEDGKPKGGENLYTIPKMGGKP